jgi:hypothetical protein
MLELHWRWTSHLPRGSIDKAFLCAFDLLKLNGAHLRREPVEVAQGYMASILQKSLHVRHQRSLDRTGGLNKGEFLAHRNVHRSEDETANPTIEGTG